MTMTLISSTNITAGVNSVTISSLPQTFDDLYIVATVKSDLNVMAYGILTFNGATSGWAATTLYGTGSSTSATTYADNGWMFRMPWANTTASVYNNISVYVPNYQLATYKIGSSENVTENNGTTAYQEIHGWQWSNTAAITSLTLALSGGYFDYNCKISIYGITKGSGGATVS